MQLNNLINECNFILTVKGKKEDEDSSSFPTTVPNTSVSPI